MKNPLTLIFVFISTFCFGQVSFGVKAGLNHSNIAHNSDDRVYEETKSRSDFHLGGYMQVPLNEKFSLIPELVYTKRGFKTEESIFSPEIRYKVNYLEVPVIVSYSPIVWLGIDLGPSVAYQLSAYAKSGDGKNDISDAFDRKLDLGLNAGLRVKANEKLAVVFRYYYGLTSILDVDMRDENNMVTGQINYFNRSAQLGVSYRLK